MWPHPSRRRQVPFSCSYAAATTPKATAAAAAAAVTNTAVGPRPTATPTASPAVALVAAAAAALGLLEPPVGKEARGAASSPHTPPNKQDGVVSCL